MFCLWVNSAIASQKPLASVANLNNSLKVIATSNASTVVAQTSPAPTTSFQIDSQQKSENSQPPKCVSIIQDRSLQPSPNPPPENNQSSPPEDTKLNLSSQLNPNPPPENNQLSPPEETNLRLSSKLSPPNPPPEKNQISQPDEINLGVSSQPSPNPLPEKNQPSSIDKSFFVKKIDVRGNTVLSAEEIKSITQPQEGKNLTRQQLVDVADKITLLYLKRGYITSRAVLVDQTVEAGEVVIRVFEGGVDEIRVQGTRRLNPEYICSRIRLAGLNPLRKQKLEDQLILMRSDPLFKNVEASLRPAGDGSKFGQSTIIVRVTEANPFKSTFGVDNYSPPSVGSERFGAALGYRNLIVSGDQISGSYNRSTTGGLNLYDFNYRVPLNAMNGTLEVRAAINDTKITDPAFKKLNIRGNSDLYEISYRQPLVRSPREEFALSLGFAYQDGQTFLFENLPYAFGIGPDKNGVSRTSVFKFGQDYVNRDLKGAWTMRSLFSLGTGLLDATINNHPTPDGRFFSWYGQIQRIQELNQDQQLITGIDLQLTPNSLLPSQQFIIGGGESVRGYRQNARSGDNGVRFSVENQITVMRNEAGLSIMQLAPFIDAGAIWNNPNNPNNRFLPSQRFLSSAGLGLLLQLMPDLNMRLDYAIPFIDLRDRGKNAQDDGFYFSVYYQP